MARGNPPRQQLSRARVVQAAIELADAEGIEALSMRHLAERLGVVPMALYKHVGDKEDLLDAMVDELIGQVRAAEAGETGPAPTPDPTPGPVRASGAENTPLPAGQPDWADAIRRTILATRTVVQRHGWARRVIETRTVRTPTVLGHMEHLTQLFLRGGLSPDLVHHVMHALGNRIWGFSPELFDESPGGRTRESRSRAEQPDPADYPGIIAIATDAAARRPGATGCDEEFEFRFALDLLLDGITRLQESGWTSTPGRLTPED
ncbi:regulatory protein, tetR family [Raineyella antarctica]|uniref:Regulatory protein, tetR family n=1 Tax=Raineyella antarctica TaxID=1577474 RepID=A0A1G6GEL5_9ACTN|nr:TetR/AcrR family transcriptional regulator [Raineyella antarctica]SDB80452.1 regulatory protein, tetR family [Raineyella antarctica]